MADSSGESPVALSPATFARHDAAVRFVEGDVMTRAPRPDSSRFPGLAPGAWGLLASGGTITAGSGTTLGTGSVKLCDKDGTVYPEDESVDVLNSGAAVTASGGARIVRLGWTIGSWALSCPGAAS